MGRERKFAVLIDADNVSDRYIKLILDEVSNDGIATYRRIYGDWTNPALSSWKKALLDNSVLPIQQYGYTTGKNATDSALIIDAMDILYSGQVDGFYIVSSDSDFTRLAARLRESGMMVVGMGEKKTPKAFVSACNRFKYLDILQDAADSFPNETKTASRSYGRKQQPVQTAPPPSQSAKKSIFSEEEREYITSLATVVATVRSLVEEYSDDEDWMFTGSIGNLLVKRYPDFDTRNYGYKKLTQFLESLRIFEFKSVPTGDGDARLIYVKLKEQEL